MNQSANNRTRVLIIGILLLLLSLLIDWLTLENPTVTGFGAVPFEIGQMTATGLNGYLGLSFLRLPIWLVVVFGILSLVLLVLNQRRNTSLPRWSYIAAGVLSAVYVMTAVWVGLFSGEASLRAGPLLALAGLILGAMAGIREVQEPNQSLQPTAPLGRG